MHLLVAPAGSGKTTYLIEKVRTFAAEGKRVWWVGLPSQRSYVYQKLTQAGALLGVEFLSSQQVYYRLLAHALKLKPLLVGTGRLALVGEALLELRNEVPAPGEARLFAQAIAEAKRYGLNPNSINPKDEEMTRLKAVFTRYERLNEASWDYDDFRLETLNHALNMSKAPEAEVIIIDGFREIGPVELRIYKALSSHCDVYLSLAECPPNETASLSLPARSSSSQLVYKASNPVSEARWVLRSLKKDLAEGINKLDLAVIMPDREIKAFIALADEYGVPMMDETPKALADTLAGRLLLDLLELPDYPTASRLLAIPDLKELANAALNKGVAGLEAMNVLASEFNLTQDWKKWLGLLELEESGRELEWAESLLETSLPDIRYDLISDESLAWKQFKKHALLRAKEASTLAKGASFRRWWSALLQETFLFDRPKGGVALLNHKLASGRRFKKAYVLHAVEGAYSVGESEDYFIPEEDRNQLAKSFANLGLPKRYLGRDTSLYEELRTRGDTVVITYSEANQSGPLEVNLDLIKQDAKTVMALPNLAAASRLELESSEQFTALIEPLALGRISVQKLLRYDDCAFRYWAEVQLPLSDDKPDWLELINQMRDYQKLNPARLELLKTEFGDYASWLNKHEERFSVLTFGETVSPSEESPFAYIDAAGRMGSEINFYRFVEPKTVTEQSEAASYIDRRWNELFAASYMLERFKGRVTKVNIYVWPVGAEPIAAYDGGIAYIWRRMANQQQKIAAAHKKFKRGIVTPNPGFRCRDCSVSDICRVGQR